MFGTKKKALVLVVGAGPVGMVTALSLAQRGLDVHIIDAEWRSTARSYALALHPSTLDLLGSLGLADDLKAKGHVVDRMAFYNGNERCGYVSYLELSGRHPYLLVVPQYGLEDQLESALGKHRVTVHWNHRVARIDQRADVVTSWIHKLEKDSVGYATATTSWVVAKETAFKSDYLIGADGHRSLVRRANELAFPEYGGTQTFAVFEFTASTWDIHEVRVVFADNTTNVLWPLGGGRYRWSFQIDDIKGAENRPKSRLSVQVGEHSYAHLDGELLDTLISARAPWFDADIEELTWSVEVRFERRLVERMGDRRIWLVGDAAHLYTPLGVHSMNIGMREGHDLASRIADIWQGHGSAHGLAEFEGATLSEWRALLGLEGGYVVGDDAPGWVPGFAERIAAAIPASGAHRVQLLSQLGIYPTT